MYYWHLLALGFGTIFPRVLVFVVASWVTLLYESAFVDNLCLHGTSILREWLFWVIPTSIVLEVLIKNQGYSSVLTVWRFLIFLSILERLPWGVQVKKDLDGWVKIWKSRKTDFVSKKGNVLFSSTVERYRHTDT